MNFIPVSLAPQEMTSNSTKHNFISICNEGGLVESFVGILLSINKHLAGWVSPTSNSSCFQPEAFYRTKGPKVAEEPRSLTGLHYTNIF